MSDIEVVRRALMMRDAGYGNPDHVWEQVGSLLKKHDRLRAALAKAERERDELECRYETHIDEILARTHKAEADLAEAEGRSAGLTEAIIRTRRRLESFCNETNAGRMPGDAREFMRRVQCGFDSLMEEAAQIKNERAERAEADLAAARGAMKRTLYHLAKLVNCGDEDEDGNQIPGVREAAIAQVLETRAFLERTATSSDPAPQSDQSSPPGFPSSG